MRRGWCLLLLFSSLSYSHYSTSSLNLVSDFLGESGDDDERKGRCLLLLLSRLIKIMSSDMYAALHSGMCLLQFNFLKQHLFIVHHFKVYLNGIQKLFQVGEV